ncbi:MAG TPA: TetR/AcrR family transcriptional regulator C-terminal domain-containing protein, partial [Euzebyales bacterium]|nr:TetR/AcrR family transcriptional regulator C-terminal domain-containing protein [Euzebyales bacterium]
QYDEEPKPGPKQGLTVDAIVAAAIEVADEHGMAALSMRAVGERLGRTGMALYTYVPSKSELVDLMYDTVIAEAHAEYDLTGGWRPALAAWAEDMWAFYLRHPWVLQVSQARPVLGPNEYVVLDTVLGIVLETGLAPTEVRRLTDARFHCVRGVAQVVAEIREAAAATGTSEDEWWHTREPLLSELAPDFDTRFPMVAKVADAGGFTMADETRTYQEQAATETFHAGLAALLDGIEASEARKT